ncbi:UDP-glucose--hexose-1-phosphate uridylyltransferase [Allomuricauda sp. ARW1Y1]|jgi:UDPglucose--hexose-1-phosphate uridylyltransferase|uniref:UDP-glucose--hexose-1-phosphate uridylyltransferase n=1 Tax=Allomuricauda sp. ARW1Y1 TaxID=2663843 RepID=UPI0015C9B8DB|nr:UDP-glucose--hexose-1-phosphate uridylyltransferase [Muricauda sp. ARW1Y1]NYJ27901.1 UDPglucose--hexose-1-phosphate uridylyltransferase [Muricauda sp. ARW1Y1]
MRINLNKQAHQRYNILTGEWILVSPHRTQRPWQGKQEKIVAETRKSYETDCYLCPGNTRASGIVNPNYDSVYSFTNDYSALLEDTPTIDMVEGLFRSRGESGICKVVCFSPDHSLTLPLMETKDITKVVEIWQMEYQGLGSRTDVNHVQIFENKGELMGCSNPHPHGQIWAQNSIPLEVEKKSAQQLAYWDSNGRSLLKDYLDQEIKANERIIVQNDDFIAFVPYWAVWPFEVMIAPRKHYQNITQLSESERTSFARMIKEVTIKYDNLFETSFPYSSGIHQAPTDGKKHDEWHFHMSFYPPLLRSATIKKFMVGYEMFANPQRDITAEQAAERLKLLSGIHYTKQNQGS